MSAAWADANVDVWLGGGTDGGGTGGGGAGTAGVPGISGFMFSRTVSTIDDCSGVNVLVLLDKY